MLVELAKVSIPLKSGHIVTLEDLTGGVIRLSFNPLKVGSYCNGENMVKVFSAFCFNPLKVGSYCNTWHSLGPYLVRLVSIPLKSGHIVTPSALI